MDSKRISNHILTVLSRNTVRMSMMKFSVMTVPTSCQGSFLVCMEYRPMNPEAVYTDCFAHRLNLSLVNTMRGAGKVSEVLELLSVLCTFLSDSNVHIEFQCDERQPISLKNLLFLAALQCMNHVMLCFVRFRLSTIP